MKRNHYRELIKWSSFPSLLLLITFIILNTIVFRNFFSADFLVSFISTNVPLICVAIGLAVVLLSGGLDISVGSMLSLVNVVIVVLTTNGYSLFIAIPVGILVGIIAGAINGIIIAVLRVSPLLTTFATSSIYLGIALTILPSPGGSIPIDFVLWYIGDFKGISTSLVFVFIGLLAWVIIKKTKIGLWIKAIGRSNLKAYFSAIPIHYVKLFSYIFSGFMSAIGAIALTGNLGAGDPLVGIPFTMTTIAACVIGGLSLAGGTGDIFGAIMGALFLGLVSNIVSSVVSDPFFQNFYSGVILLMGLIGSVMISEHIKKITG